MTTTTMNISLDDLFLNARTDTYAALAALLNRAPGPELLSQIQHIELNPGMHDRLIEKWFELRTAARAYPASVIEKEYQAVFVGLGQGEVIPYASWYLEGLLMTMPLARLRLDLIKLGIARRKEVHEAEDHAGLLCETMALLGRERNIALKAYARFFDAHVGSWMFAFFKDVQKAPSADFYRSVAGLGLCLLELEQMYLSLHCPARVH